MGLGEATRKSEELAKRVGKEIGPLTYADYGFWVLPILEGIVEMLVEVQKAVLDLTMRPSSPPLVRCSVCKTLYDRSMMVGGGREGVAVVNLCRFCDKGEVSDEDIHDALDSECVVSDDDSDDGC